MPPATLQDLMRRIPAVDQLLLRPVIAGWVRRAGRGFVVSEIQRLLQETRDSLRGGGEVPVDPALLEGTLSERLKARLEPRLLPVINATGVVLHTNLGRAPLSEAARAALSAVSGGYTNLEYDLSTGRRSQRDRAVEDALCDVLGCEAALVANNNAAAVFLILNTFARGREVVVSRGELIEIGGSFRIPDIMARSGTILREVGTTNRTRLADYESGIGPETALLMRIHPSNYRVRGFTHRPDLGELVALARRRGVPLVEDVGSGCLLDLSSYGVSDEPVVQESLRAGADLVCFSCDKLLGGPQAGVVAGSRALVEAVRRNPLMRAFRVEKLIYGALEATLRSYRTGRAVEEIPVLRMIALSGDELRRRSRRFLRRLKPRLPAGAAASLVEGDSVIGGGSCPDTVLPTTLVSIHAEHVAPDILENRLRAHRPPVIVRVEEGRTLVDLRAVRPAEEAALVEALGHALACP